MNWFLFAASAILIVQQTHAAPDCTQTQLFIALKQIAHVGLLHNCSLSIAVLDEDDPKIDTVSIYIEASDLYLCEYAKPCLTSSEYFTLSKSCFASASTSIFEPRKLQYLIGYQLGSKQIARGIQLQLNYLNQIQKLELMTRDLVSGEYLSRVKCSPER